MKTIVTAGKGREMFMRSALTCCLLGVLMLSVAPVLYAGEINILVDKLVEKGILSPLEAQIILDETKQEVARDIAQGKSDVLPAWVQKIKLKGDLRLRYQYEKKNLSTEGRNRGRLRYRLGIEAKVVDGVKVGAGLASGGSDPRSTNQSLENTFDTPDVRLDYAYAEYEPANGFKAIAGKFKRKPYLWQTTDFMWDGDINPEGGSLALTHSLLENVDGFLNAGIWTLDEIDNNSSGFTNTDHQDPFLHYVQGGVKWKEGDYDATLAGIYYGFNGVKGAALENGKSTNTMTGSVLKYDYDSGGLSAEVGAQKMFGGLPLDIDERIAVFGDYLVNPDPEEQNVAWAAGVKFGNKKIKGAGDWQAKYQYAWVGKDAVLDTFPDSDRFGGSTDVKSHEAILQYGLKKNVILGLDYYQTQRIKSTQNLEHLVQTDVMFKF